jgi:hypothetical protein
MALLISSRMDEHLDEAINNLVNQHLSECSSCALLDKKLRNLRTVLRSAEPEINENIGQISLQSIEQTQQKSKNTILSFPLSPKRLACAALLLFGFSCTFFLGHFFSDTLTKSIPAFSRNFHENLTSDNTFPATEEPFDLLSYYESIDPESPVLLQYSTFNTTPLSSFEFDGE